MGPSIFIAQYYTDNLKHGPYAEAINRKYCQEKGYQYFVEKNTTKIREEIQDRAPTWYKPKLIKEVFQEFNPDYVLFLDTDAIVNDFDQNIEQFIDQNYDIVLSEDVSAHSVANAGVFLIKNSEWSRNFLDKWWSLGEEATNKDTTRLDTNENSDTRPGYFKQALWMDQTILTIMYDEFPEYRSRMKIISSRNFNHREHSQGNFIFHAYSYGLHPYRYLDRRYRHKFDQLLFDVFEDTEKSTDKKIIVYHIFCYGDYKQVVNQQIDRLLRSGVYDWCDKLIVTCSSPSKEFDYIQAFFKEYDKSVVYYTYENKYEYWPLRIIWDISQKYKGQVLYFHTKGITNRYKNYDTKEASEIKSKSVDFWKELLEYYVIDNWKTCLKKLKNHDNVSVTNNSGWLWGNFWWANLEYIKNNQKPNDSVDRWWYEAWLNNGREHSTYEFWHFEHNAYLTYLPDSIYKAPKEWEGEKIKLITAKYGTNGIQIDEGHGSNYSGDINQLDIYNRIYNSLKSHNFRSIRCEIGDNSCGDPAFGQRKFVDMEIELKGQKYCLGYDAPTVVKFSLP